MNKILATALVTAVLFAVPRFALASEFDDAMQPVLGAYLQIHAALAADSIKGVDTAAAKIAELAPKLDTAKAPAADRERYARLPADLATAARALGSAEDLAGAREAFKKLSVPLAVWVAASLPKGKAVLYCPMAEATWVQDGAKPANPYLGAKMPGCGKKVGGSE